MKRLVATVLFTLAALFLCAWPLFAQSPGQQGQYKWYGHAKDPNVLLLYWNDSVLVGVLDPEAGSWRWTMDGKPSDLIRALTGKPRDGTGHRPGVGGLPDPKPVPAPAGSGPGKPAGKLTCGCGEQCEGFGGTDCPCGCMSGDSKGHYPKSGGPGIEETNPKDGTRDMPVPRVIADREKCRCGIYCSCKDGTVEPDCKCQGCRCADVATARKPAADVIDGSPRGPTDWQRHGVILKKLNPVERYQVSGREVQAAEALELITAGSVPDDSKHIRITVIGGDAARRQVRSDLDHATSLAWLKPLAVVNDYAPTHWRVTSGGFVTPPTPDGVTIYAQKPDGTVLWRQDAYAGPDDLAKALRDKVPGYDPNKDPSPKTPTPKPGPTPAVPDDWLKWLLTIPAGLLSYLVAKKRSIA